jgi:diacylglycerol O-acyltransferase / wax synthase
VTVDRMSPLDSSFLHIEDGVTHMHIGSVSIMDGPPPPYEAVCRMIAGKLNLVPRYRQVVRRVPFDLGRPVWVDDPHFNLEYHLRRTGLPRPGGETELRRLVGRVMAQQLDRAKPLWEMWMVEGLDHQQWAVVSKVHHCMVDGVSGSDLMSLILDHSPDTPIPEAPPWEAGPVPASWELAAEAVWDMASSPFEMARALRARTRIPRRAARQVWETVSGIGQVVSGLRPTTRTSLNGPIGPHRRWVATSVPVSDIKAVRREIGGTFNDVVLAIITRGFRDLLRSRGETVDSPVRTLVPVSVRPRDERGRAVGDGTLANRVSAVFAELPVGIADPVARLEAISAQMADLKESKRALAGETLTNLGGFAPPVLLALGERLITKVSQHSINTVTTNVPGPQIPLYAVGRRMLRSYPYVPLGIQMRIGVAIFSYDGEVHFGITGDYDTAADLEILADGIDAGMLELLGAGSATRGRPDAVDLPQPARSGTRAPG